MAFEIGRTGHIDQRQLADRPRDHGRIRKRPDAQHAVDILLDKIDRAIGDTEFNLDLRMGGEKFRKRRSRSAARSVRACRSSLCRKTVGAAPEQRFRLLHFADQAHAALIESRAIVVGATRRVVR
jgi:hypothetical protein